MEQSSFTEVAKRALDFRQTYYKMLDNLAERCNIVNLYAPDVPNLSEWNGHALSTQQEILAYLQQLPKTQHQVDTVDAQPLPGNDGGDFFVLVVHGIVTYDDEHKREFYQRLTVSRLNGKYYIINDYYRWLAERP